MNRYEFEVTKIEEGGKIWKHRIGIYEDDKFNAIALIEQIFPSSAYKYEFIDNANSR